MRYPEENGKKCYEEEDEESVRENRNSRAPDGGWGWMVMFAGFICISIVDGICFSFSTIMYEIINEFETEGFGVAWVGSSLAGTYLLVGPFVASACTRYGCRKVCVAGSIVSSLGFILATQADSLAFLIVSYGIIGGIGFGMIYLPAIVSVGYYFQKRRAFATGITLCGSGVGNFVFMSLINTLLDHYTLRGTFLILAGVILNCAVGGMMFFPLKMSHIEEPDPDNYEIERGCIMKALIEDKKRQRTISNGSLDNCIITRDNKLIKLDPKIFELKRNDSFLARFKRQLGFSSTSLARSHNGSTQGIPSIVIDAVKREHENRGSPIFRPNGTKVRPNPQRNLHKCDSFPNSSFVGPAADNCDSTSLLSNGTVVSNCTNNGTVPIGMPKTRSCGLLSDEASNNPSTIVDLRGQSLQHCMATLGHATTRSVSDLEQPSGVVSLNGSIMSIQLLPTGVRRSGGSSLRSSHLSVNRQRSSNSFGEYTTVGSQLTTANNSCMNSCCGSFASVPQIQASLEEIEIELTRQQSMVWRWWHVLAEMFDLSLLGNGVFLLLVLSSMLTLLGFFIPYMWLPDKGIELGMSNDQSLFLVNVISITSLVGRALAGWLADRPWVNTLYLNIGSLIVAGVSLLLCPLITSMEHLHWVAATFGFSLATFYALRSIVLVEYLGLERLTMSFGLLILFQGSAAFLGAPIAGFLKQRTESVDDSLYMAGGVILLSGLLLVPIKFLAKRESLDKKQTVPYAATPLAMNGHMKKTLM